MVVLLEDAKEFSQKQFYSPNILGKYLTSVDTPLTGALIALKTNN